MEYIGDMIDVETLELERLRASAGAATDLLRALSNPHRLLVLCQLESGEKQVADLLEGSGLSQSALSQHLARLREEGLIAARREGTAVFYRIADPSALKVIGVLAEIFCPPVS